MAPGSKSTFFEGRKRHFAVPGADGARPQPASLPDLTSVGSGSIEPPVAPRKCSRAPFFTDVGTDRQAKGPVTYSPRSRHPNTSPKRQRVGARFYSPRSRRPNTSPKRQRVGVRFSSPRSRRPNTSPKRQRVGVHTCHTCARQETTSMCGVSGWTPEQPLQFRHGSTSAFSELARAGWLRSSWRLPASPQCGTCQVGERTPEFAVTRIKSCASTILVDSAKLASFGAFSPPCFADVATLRSQAIGRSRSRRIFVRIVAACHWVRSAEIANQSS